MLTNDAELRNALSSSLGRWSRELTNFNLSLSQFGPLTEGGE